MGRNDMALIPYEIKQILKTEDISSKAYLAVKAVEYEREKVTIRRCLEIDYGAKFEKSGWFDIIIIGTNRRTLSTGELKEYIKRRSNRKGLRPAKENYQGYKSNKSNYWPRQWLRKEIDRYIRKLLK